MYEKKNSVYHFLFQSIICLIMNSSSLYFSICPLDIFLPYISLYVSCLSFYYISFFHMSLSRKSCFCMSISCMSFILPPLPKKNFLLYIYLFFSCLFYIYPSSKYISSIYPSCICHHISL